MENSKQNSENIEAETRKKPITLIICILCFAGITMIIAYWIYLRDLAVYLTLAEITFIGFLILALKKGWVGGSGSGGDSGGDSGGGGCGGGE